ncbi:MAG: hypothetical protein QXU97_04550 [Fervidicoccaceae archaeon]
MIRVSVRGRPSYWRLTVYSWLLEIREILEGELGEEVSIEIEEGESELPELLVDGVPIGEGVPGEEGYLIEIVKKAVESLRVSRL